MTPTELFPNDPKLTLRVDIAVRLREERQRIGYSQRAFAREIGVTRESLRLYENGQRCLSSEALANSFPLGVDVQYVLAGWRSGSKRIGCELNWSGTAPSQPSPASRSRAA